MRGGAAVTFNEALSQMIAMLQQHGRVSYRALKRQFAIDDAFLEDLKYELIAVQQRAVDQDDPVLVWMGETGAATAPMPAPPPSSSVPPPATRDAPEPIAYTPAYLAEKILTSRSALEGERKQVTVLFADLKGSMELLADRDPGLPSGGCGSLSANWLSTAGARWKNREPLWQGAWLTICINSKRSDKPGARQLG